MIGMKIVKDIRKALKLEPWPMSKKLSVSIQTYQHLENEASTMGLKTAFKLQDVATKDLGWTAEKFWSELKKSVGVK